MTITHDMMLRGIPIIETSAKRKGLVDSYELLFFYIYPHGVINKRRQPLEKLWYPMLKYLCKIIHIQ